MGATGNDKDSSAELSLDEFCEIAARICNAKLADRAADEPFETTLDTWLGLFFVPAINNAAKRFEQQGGAAARKKKRIAKRNARNSKMGVDVQFEGDEVVTDPTASSPSNPKLENDADAGKA